MLEIFQFDFMVRAFAAGIIVSLLAPFIGMFLVVRRYSYLADTLAHVSLVGVAGGILTGVNPVLGALFISTLSAVGIEYLRGAKKIFGESVLAIFLSGSLAIALVLMSLKKGFQVDLMSYLFGSITTVTTSEIQLLGIFALFGLCFLFVFYKKIFLLVLDEELAQAEGMKVKVFNLFLIFLSAITISFSLRIVGGLLIGALMVVPVVTALQFKKSFFHTTLLSIVFSFLSVIGGLFLSFYFDVVSGGAIVVVALVFFLLSLFFSKK